MPEKISKLQRWLDLIAYLVGRRYPVSVDEIMEHVPAYVGGRASETDDASVRRMFERDKDELREIGIPIETVEIPEGGGADPSQGHRIARSDFYLPYLELIGAAETGRAPVMMRGVASLEIRPEELATAREALDRVAELPAFPLRREARAARLKLAFDVPFRAPERSRSLVVQRPDAEAVRVRLRTLSDALLRRKRIRFGYHGIYRGTDTEREVAAYGLLFQRGHWYLIGHDQLRDAVRIFRIDRMESPQPNAKEPKKPDYEIPAEFDLARYRDRQAWELDGTDDESVQARVAFRFPASLWVDRNRYGERLEQRPDGSSVRAFKVNQVNPFLRWILSLGGEAEIVAPPELRDAFAEMAREVAALYRRDR
ncbi:YafY family protein [soil metagenome]